MRDKLILALSIIVACAVISLFVIEFIAQFKYGGEFIALADNL